MVWADGSGVMVWGMKGFFFDFFGPLSTNLTLFKRLLFMYSNGLPILDGVEPKIKNDGLCIMIEWTFRLILWKNSQIFLKFKCIILSEFIPNQVLVLLFHFFQINYCILV